MHLSSKQRLIQKAAKYNFILLVVGLAIRPFIVPTPLSFLPWALINSLIYGLTYYLIRSGKTGQYSAFALFSSTFFVLTCMLFLSNGIEGHLAYTLPLVPVFAGLILSARGLWLTCLLNIFLILAVGVYCIPPDATSMPPDILRKMVWLMLANIMGASFSRAYVRENEFLEAELKHEANIDYLTRVYNRRGIEQKLEHEIKLAKAYKRSLCVMMIDLDHFKRYNDLNGHLAGDYFLRDVSKLFNDLVTEKGGFIGRYGGEELIALIPGYEADYIDDLAKSLNMIVRNMAIPIGAGLSEVLTICVGYCYKDPDDITDAESMIDQADRKLYECKSEGRDLVKGNISSATTNPFISVAGSN